MTAEVVPSNEIAPASKRSDFWQIIPASAAAAVFEKTHSSPAPHDFVHGLTHLGVQPSSNVHVSPEAQPVVAPGDGNYGTARLVLADLVDAEKRYRHDTDRLAAAVMRAYYERDLRAQVSVAFKD